MRARSTGRVIVGSASAADLVIADTMVSRIHAELEPRPDGVWVRDLGSRNGTFIGDVLVRHGRLPARGVLRVGATELAVDEPIDDTVTLWPHARFGGRVGTSVARRELFATLARVATLDSTVLIVGETGTGKELVARAIHDASPRASAPFVVVDYGSMPEALLESELFGHAKGAFSGATATTEGAIEAADRGTVFLDELGELPLAMQPKLLRAIESRTVRRLGETNHRPVDVRFVAATHRDLPTMVNEGGFREDLYFRIAVLPITIPPLRDRLDDVPLLLQRFLPDMPEAERDQLVAEARRNRWPGNARELRNFAERVQALGAQRALAMAAPAVAAITPAALPAPGGLAFEASFRAFCDAAEREYVRQLVLRHAGDMPGAARARQASTARTYIA